MRKLITGAIFVCAIVFTPTFPLHAEIPRRNFIWPGIDLRFVVHEDALISELRNMSGISEHVVVGYFSEQIPDYFCLRHLDNFIERKTANAIDFSFGWQNLWMMLQPLLSEQSPRFEQMVGRFGTCYSKLEVASTGVSAIIHRSIYGYCPTLSWIAHHIERGLIKRDECSLADNEGVVSRNPLLASIPSCYASAAGGCHNENENKIFEPMFGFGLGAIVIALGGWWCCFTARHRTMFLPLGAAMLIGGFFVMMFADLVQLAVARLLFSALLLMFSHNVGLSV